MRDPEKFWNNMAKDMDPQSDQLDENQSCLVQKISKHLHEHDVVLDYGCARGGISLALADKVKMIHGIDLSSKMIVIAEKRMARRNVKNAVFQQAQLYDTPFPPASFEVILALNVLHLVENPNQTVAQINKLLRPGGRFIFETPCLKGDGKILGYILKPLIKIAVKTGLIPHVNFFSPNDSEFLVTSNGFQILETNKGLIDISHWVVAQKE
jgi:2-polyprenyl-3-methyl-5-hydroxy-6-metoxy-1,4-benzoquinol methylase